MEVNTTEEKTTVENAALDIEKKAASLPQEVQERIPVIAGQEDLTRANNALAYIRQVRKAISDVFGPIVDDARKAWKTALGKKQGLEKPLDEAEAFVKGSIKGYSLKLARERQEAEDAEKKRLAGIARVAEEKIQEAIEAERVGDKERADSILEEAVVQVEEETKGAPVVIPEVPKMQAAVMRDHWAWREVDFSLIPREYLMLDRVKVNIIVTRNKDKTNIPGIEAYNDPIVSHAKEKK